MVTLCTTSFLLLLLRYSPLCALASLTTSLHRSLFRAFFHHACISKVFLSSCYFLAAKFIFLQDALSSILAVCHNRFNLSIWSIFTVLVSWYKLYSSTLYFILHTPLTQLGQKIFLNLFLSNMLHQFSWQSSSHIRAAPQVWLVFCVFYILCLSLAVLISICFSIHSSIYSPY